MFGKKETEKTSESTSFTTKTTQNQIRTLISEGCKFEGNLFSPAYTRIDGIVRGNLTGESGLIIGDKGIIEGDVMSIEVVVYGDVKGNIKAHKLEIKKGGKICGDVVIDHLIMEYGAKFGGHCKMNESGDAIADAYKLPDNKKDFKLPEKKAEYKLPDTKSEYKLPDTKSEYKLPDTKSEYKLPDKKD